MTHPLSDLDTVKAFTFAGKARLTLVSKVSGARFTYKINGHENKPNFFFVSLLTGADNETAYNYLGIIDNGQFRLTFKSRITPDAPSAKAFNFFFNHLQAGKIANGLEIWHEGCCGRCGRTLTVPSSIENGIGPECIKVMMSS